MKEAEKVPFDSMPSLIRGSFLTKEQLEKLKETFKDVVSVVRCKDCKYHDEEGKNFCDCGDRPDEWFCAGGVRR